MDALRASQADVLEPTHPPDAGGVTWGEMTLALAAGIRLLVAVPLIVGIGAAALLLQVRNRYVASVAMVPEVRGEGLPGQLATLAAIARVTVPASQQSQSPQFYASVLRSRPIVYAVLSRRYALPVRPLDIDSVMLVDILEAKGRTPAERFENAARKLQRVTDVTYDLRTAIIRVSVEMRSPILAAAVANAYAGELDRFNREVRQSQARARRQFIEEQLRGASTDLARAEDAVKSFLVRNRQYQESPPLVFEFTRLQRALTVQQELYLDLRRQLDAARISEVNDLPVVSVIESAIPPVRKSGPARTKWLLGMMFLAVAVVGAYLVLRQYHARLFPALVPAANQAWRQLHRTGWRARGSAPG